MLALLTDRYHIMGGAARVFMSHLTCDELAPDALHSTLTAAYMYFLFDVDAGDFTLRHVRKEIVCAATPLDAAG